MSFVRSFLALFIVIAACAQDVPDFVLEAHRYFGQMQTHDVLSLDTEEVDEHLEDDVRRFVAYCVSLTDEERKAVVASMNAVWREDEVEGFLAGTICSSAVLVSSVDTALYDNWLPGYIESLRKFIKIADDGNSPAGAVVKCGNRIAYSLVMIPENEDIRLLCSTFVSGCHCDDQYYQMLVSMGLCVPALSAKDFSDVSMNGISASQKKRIFSGGALSQDASFALIDWMLRDAVHSEKSAYGAMAMLPRLHVLSADYEKLLALASVSEGRSWMPWMFLSAETKAHVKEGLAVLYGQKLDWLGKQEQRSQDRYDLEARIIGLGPLAVAGLELDESVLEKIREYIKHIGARRDQFAQQELACAVSVLVCNENNPIGEISKYSYLNESDPDLATVPLCSYYSRYMFSRVLPSVAGQPPKEYDVMSDDGAELITLRYYPKWSKGSAALASAIANGAGRRKELVPTALYFSRNSLDSMKDLPGLQAFLRESAQSADELGTRVRATLLLAYWYGGEIPTTIKDEVLSVGNHELAAELLIAMYQSGGIKADDALVDLMADGSGGGFVRWWLGNKGGSFPVDEYFAVASNSEAAFIFRLLSADYKRASAHMEILSDPRAIVGLHVGGDAASTLLSGRSVQAMIAPSGLQSLLAELTVLRLLNKNSALKLAF